MNKVIIIGRLTRDPDIHNTNNTTVARFNLAVDRKYKQDGGQTADYPSVVAFGKTAEFISKYFKRGVKMALEGRIQTGDYTDKDGIKHYTTDIIAESVEFAESKKVEETPPSAPSDFISVPEDVVNDLPFK